MQAKVEYAKKEGRPCTTCHGQVLREEVGLPMPFRMPAEHGAWGILLVPFVCAAVLAGAWGWPPALALVCLLALFLLRGSVEAQGGWQSWNRPGHLALAAAAAVSSGLLIFSYRRFELVELGAATAAIYLLHYWLAERHRRVRQEKRSLAAELLGVMLLTAAAPVTWIAARGRLDSRGLEVWMANLLFFLGGVLYVKYRVRGVLAHKTFGRMRERLAFAWPVVLYHLLVLAFLVSCVLLESLPAAVLLAFVPATLRGAGLLFRLGRSFPIRRLGWSEVAHSLVFATLLILVFRSPA